MKRVQDLKIAEYAEVDLMEAFKMKIWLAKKVDMSMEDNSRRSFFKKAVAAAGVVATAGYASTLISKPSASNGNASAKYAADVALQGKAVAENQLIMMTDDEKKQRLNELLNCHYQELA